MPSSSRLPLTFALLVPLAGAMPSAVSAQEFLGLDPYNRPIYAHDPRAAAQKRVVRGPVFQSRPGKIGGPLLAGPLYYVEPAPVIGGRYVSDSALRAGAVLGFDVDRALWAARRNHR